MIESHPDEDIFDSSAFAKRFVLEEGSPIIEEICLETPALGLCMICIPELISAFRRKITERTLDPQKYHIIKERLIEEIKDAIMINITPSVINTSIALLESINLRTMHFLHLACAIEWNTDLFVSSDHRQIEAAKKSGLAVRNV